MACYVGMYDGRERVIAKKDDLSEAKEFYKGDTLAVVKQHDDGSIFCRNLTRPRLTGVIEGFALKSEFKYVNKRTSEDEDEYVVKIIGIPLFRIKRMGDE